MHKCKLRRLAKVKVLKLPNDVLMQGASLEEVDKVLVKTRRATRHRAIFFRKINQEDALDNVSVAATARKMKTCIHFPLHHPLPSRME